MSDIERLQRDLTELSIELKRLGIRSAVIEEKIAALKEDVQTLRDDSTRLYVPVSRYLPVERLSFGAVAAVGLAIIGAIMALVLR